MNFCQYLFARLGFANLHFPHSPLPDIFRVVSEFRDLVGDLAHVFHARVPGQVSSDKNVRILSPLWPFKKQLKNPAYGKH